MLYFVRFIVRGYPCLLLSIFFSSEKLIFECFLGMSKNLSIQSQVWAFLPCNWNENVVVFYMLAFLVLSWPFPCQVDQIEYLVSLLELLRDKQQWRNLKD